MIPEVINIVKAELAGDYALSLGFDDGTCRVVDFRSFLQGSGNPAIQAYLDAQKFAGFRLDHGDLVWGDYELCFPLIDLYLGQISSQSVERVAA